MDAIKESNKASFKEDTNSAPSSKAAFTEAALAYLRGDPRAVGLTARALDMLKAERQARA